MKVLLVGNYRLDSQESMLRYARMMREGLGAVGFDCATIAPEPVFGRKFAKTHFGLGKWMGYIDKYVLFPPKLLARARFLSKEDSLIVHICDHSNAIYAPLLRKNGFRVLVTCHDLIAVRAGVENTGEYHFSVAGRFLQRSILKGLGFANGIASISGSTLHDVKRLVKDGGKGRPSAKVIWLGLNCSYSVLEKADAVQRIEKAGLSYLLQKPFLFHLGTSQPRKNRDTIIRVLAEAVKRGWDGYVVFAGDFLWPDLVALADELKMNGRVFQVGSISNELVEALYNLAHGFIFPSRSEGFGWPAIEAQACGCPVLSSNVGPLPEILGKSALFRSMEDVEGFTEDVIRLSDPAERLKLSELGRANMVNFKAETMIQKYIEFYRELEAI